MIKSFVRILRAPRAINTTFNKFYSTEATVVRYREYGEPETVLRVEKEKLADLKDNEVQIKMLAAPINPADINYIQGRYGIMEKLPAVGGNEGCGVVVKVGSRVKNLKENDRVIPARAGLGTWRTFLNAAETDLFKVPAGIAIEEAAMIAVAPTTAARLLDDFVSLKKGDVIIQNGAGSHVGRSVIQMAKQRGITTINVLRLRPNFDQFVEQIKGAGGYMAVSEDYIGTPQFRRLISDLPKPKLALNMTGGIAVKNIARVLESGGTLVTYGGMSNKAIELPTSLFIFNNLQAKGFWLTKWIEEHSREDHQKMIESMFELVKDRQLSLPFKPLSFEYFDHALKFHLEPFKNAKILLTMKK